MALTTALVVAGTAVASGAVQSRAARKAAKAGERAAEAGISEQRLAREEFREVTQPFADIGLSAGPALSALLGLQPVNPQVRELEAELASIESSIAAGPPPLAKKKKKRGGGLLGKVSGGLAGSLLGGGGGLAAQLGGGVAGGLLGGSGGGGGGAQPAFDLDALNARKAALTTQLSDLRAADTAAFESRGPQGLEEINPLVSFLREEGFEGIQESAAARGRLGSGGTLKDLTRFNTQLTSTIVPQLQQQRFNQLFNVLGLGANVSTGQGTAGLQTASNISNLLGAQGAAKAQGAINQGNIAANTLGQLSGAFGTFQGGGFGGGGAPVAGAGQGAPRTLTDFGGFA